MVLKLPRVLFGPSISVVLLLLVGCSDQTCLDTCPPGAVADLGVANLTSCSVELKWTASGDDGMAGRAAGYSIRYSTVEITEDSWVGAIQCEGEPSPAVAGARDSMCVRGLSAGTAYYFAMNVADEAANFSDLSNVVSARTLPDTVSPGLLWVNDGLGPEDEDWTNSTTELSANWDSVAGVTGYEFAIGTSRGGTDIAGWLGPLEPGQSHITYSSVSLTPGITYYFAVRVLISAGCGGWGYSDGITVDTGKPSSRVKALPEERAHLALPVSWTGSDDLSGIEEYDIQSRDGEDGAWQDWKTGTRDSIAAFAGQNGHTYYFRSRARDLAGNQEEYPDAFDAWTRLNCPVGQVPWVKDGLGDDENWTNVASQLSANWGSVDGAGGYEYAIGTTRGGRDLVDWGSAGSQTHVTHPGLALSHGSTYYFSVRAFLGLVRGAPRSSDGILVDTVPPTSHVNALASEVHDATIRVSWGGSDDLSWIASYDVQARDGESGAWWDWQVRTSLTSADFVGRRTHAYYFRCRGSDMAGNLEEYPESPDAWTTFMFLPPPVPWVHDGLGGDKQWTMSTTELSANWGMAAGADGYEYAIGTAPGGLDVAGWMSTGSETQVTQLGLALSHGSKYYFSVRALADTAHGSSKSSNGITVDTGIPTSHVNALPSEVYDETFTVSWTGTDDLSGMRTFDVQSRDGASGVWRDWKPRTTITSSDFTGQNLHTYYFRCRALDNSGNQEAYPETPDAQISVRFLPPALRNFKFALHLAQHGLHSCRNLPNIISKAGLVRVWPTPGVDLDVFFVVFDYDELALIEYGLDWPGEWGTASTAVCGADVVVGSIINPGDGIGVAWRTCQTVGVKPYFYPISYTWLYPTTNGEIQIRDNPATQMVGAMDCRGGGQYHYPVLILNAGVGVEPHEGPPHCSGRPPAWDSIKSMFK
jgi:hypothetical protein